MISGKTDISDILSEMVCLEKKNFQLLNHEAFRKPVLTYFNNLN